MSLPAKAVLHYRGANGVHGKCGITVVSRVGLRPVVVASELPDNPGPSVTNAAAQAVEEYVRSTGMSLDDFHWVEHYPQHGTYDLVEFGADGNPKWRRLGEGEAEMLARLLAEGL